MAMYQGFPQYYQPCFYKPALNYQEGECIFNDNVVRQLESAEKIAKQINESEEVADQPRYFEVVERRPRFNWSVIYISTPIYRQRRVKKEEENVSKDLLRIVAGFFFTVIFGFAIYEIGKCFAEWTQTKRACGALQKFRREDLRDMRLEASYAAGHPEHPHLTEIQKVVNIKKSIFRSIQGKATWKLALIGLVALSALGAIAGAIAGSGIAMLTGAIFTLAAAGGLLLKRALDKGDRQFKEQALEMEQTCQHLLSLKASLNAIPGTY